MPNAKSTIPIPPSRKSRLIALQRTVAPVGWLPVPTPYPYLEGFDWIVQRERSGEGYGNVYMLGRVQPGGFTGYYLVATLFKVPLGTLAIVCAALVLYVQRQRREGFLRDEWVLIVGSLPMTDTAGQTNLVHFRKLGR